MAFLLLVSLIWAFSFGLIKGRLVGVDPALVTLVRVGLGFAVFLPFFRPGRLRPRSMFFLAAVGAVQFGLMYLLVTAAYRYLKAYEVATLTIFTPILVCLFGDLGERRPRPWSWVAAGVAVLGAGVVVVDKPFEQVAWRGVALVQGSNLCFALGQVVYRRWRLAHPDVADVKVFALLFAGASLAAAPAAIPALPTISALGRDQWGVLAYLGIVASGLGFFLWNLGAARTSVGLLAVANNAKIPLALACSIWVFGETGEPWRLLAGAACMVGAGVLADRTAGGNKPPRDPVPAEG
jgi:drug/metabolite transporter (DMT)-like permease